MKRDLDAARRAEQSARRAEERRVLFGWLRLFGLVVWLAVAAATLIGWVIP